MSFGRTEYLRSLFVIALLLLKLRSWGGRANYHPPPQKNIQSLKTNNNNNKLYLHDYNKVLQYCKSHLNLIINYLIN